MTLVVAAMLLSAGVGIWAERRFGGGAQAASRRAIKVLLWLVLPFITFFTIARLDITTGVGAGLGLAYVALAVAGLLAWAAARALRLSRPSTGALIVVVVLANTGYLGVPLSAALLGRDDLPTAIAFDTVVSGPMFYVVGFAIGAIFGAAVADTAGARLRAFLLRNPPLVALIAALLAGWVGVDSVLAPDALVDAAAVLVYAILPVGFFVLGVNLAAEAEEGALPGARAVFAPAVAVALALRLVVAPAVLVAFSLAIIRLPDAYLLQAAMPAGINSLVIAHAYGLDLRLTSAALAWSTAIVATAALAAAAL